MFPKGFSTALQNYCSLNTTIATTQAGNLFLPTQLLFNKLKDGDVSLFSPADNGFKIKFPGVYLGTVRFAFVGTGGVAANINDIFTQISVNGVAASIFNVSPFVGSWDKHGIVTDILYLNAGDVLTFWFSMWTGSSSLQTIDTTPAYTKATIAKIG